MSPSPSAAKNIVMLYAMQEDAALINLVRYIQLQRIMFSTNGKEVSFKAICFLSNKTAFESELNTMHGNTVGTYSEL